MYYELELPTITYWHCDTCEQSGQVQHDKHDEVWEVYAKLVSDHATSPECEGGRYQIRVSLKPIDSEASK